MIHNIISYLFKCKLQSLVFDYLWVRCHTRVEKSTSLSYRAQESRIAPKRTIKNNKTTFHYNKFFKSNEAIHLCISLIRSRLGIPSRGHHFELNWSAHGYYYLAVPSGWS